MANKPAGGKGGIPLLFHVARAWPALPHHGRYAWRGEHYE